MSSWLRGTAQQRGAVLPLPRVMDLARAWYQDPRCDDWRPRTRDESQAVLRGVGLTGDFWELPK